MADGDEITLARRLRPAAPVPEQRSVGAATPVGPAPSTGSPQPADGTAAQAAAAGTTAVDTDAVTAADTTTTDGETTAVDTDAATAADTTTDGDTTATAGSEPAAAPAEVTAGGSTSGGAASRTTGGRRTRVPFAHAARRFPPPRQAAAGAVRAVRGWSRRPAGRVTLPALLLLVIVAATGATGAVVVPATVDGPAPSTAAEQADPTGTTPAVDPTATADPSYPATGPSGSVAPTQPAGVPGTGLGSPPVVAGRPADALSGWAAQIGAKVNVPPVAMQAYGYAELVLRQTTPACGLSWPTLAAIGKVESAHGAVNGTTLLPDGKVQPKIIGLPLDGQGGRQRITDTDAGQLDGDFRYDRALGPMQFIPSTWRQMGVDADNDGQIDPQDIDDAALAAGNYLCQGGRNLTIPQDWWSAVLSYNEVQPYAQAVYEAANQYGTASRT